MTDESDEALLAAARRGDRAALGKLLARHEAQVYRYGLRMCRNDDDAKEVLQETLLAMARTVADFRGDASIPTWLYTVARSFCIKRRRRKKGEPGASDVEPLDAAAAQRTPAEAATPEEQTAARELDRALDQAIAALPAEAREVLLLRDGEGLTAPEVASVLGLTVEAVKSRLHRARLAVRQKLAPLMAPETLAPAPGCPDVADLLSRHLEGDITAEVCRTMDAHLAGCARCRATCDSLRQVLARCHAHAEGETVPPAVQHSVRVALQDFLGR